VGVSFFKSSGIYSIIFLYMKIVVTESQLQMVLSNQNLGVLTEAKWWNAIGDIVGIFDPTGAVDLINGLDYLRQGDTFFAMLSFVSVIPYIGDLAAKPILLAGKGSKLYKTANAASKLAKENPAKAIKLLESVANSSSASRALFGKARQWAPKVKQMLDKVPGGKLMPGLINTLKDYVSLFEKMGKGTQKASSMIRRASKNPMTPAEVQSLANRIKKEVAADGRLFRDLGGASAKGVQGLKNYKMSGIPRLFGNKATRSLMRRTKFWAAFLDFIGVANFVGPDELINEMGQEQFDQSMNEFSSTSQAKQAWQDDFANVDDQATYELGYQGEPTQPKQKSQTQDFLSDMLFGPLNFA
jgi:hypothetical protein